jgi:hypothetical protein
MLSSLAGDLCRLKLPNRLAAAMHRSRHVSALDVDQRMCASSITLYGFGAVGRFDPLWAICAEVNAKNSYGGYSGFSYWFVKFRNGRAITDELGVNKGDYDCINGPSDPARRYSGS